MNCYLYFICSNFSIYFIKPLVEKYLALSGCKFPQSGSYTLQRPSLAMFSGKLKTVLNFTVFEDIVLEIEFIFKDIKYLYVCVYFLSGIISFTMHLVWLLVFWRPFLSYYTLPASLFLKYFFHCYLLLLCCFEIYQYAQKIV